MYSLFMAIYNFYQRINIRMCTYDVQRNLEATGISGVRESVTLLNCLQEPDCEAVSLVSVGFLSCFMIAFITHTRTVAIYRNRVITSYEVKLRDILSVSTTYSQHRRKHTCILYCCHNDYCNFYRNQAMHGLRLSSRETRKTSTDRHFLCLHVCRLVTLYFSQIMPVYIVKCFRVICWLTRQFAFCVNCMRP